MLGSADRASRDTRDQTQVVAANSYLVHCRTPFFIWLALVTPSSQSVMTDSVEHFKTYHDCFELHYIPFLMSNIICSISTHMLEDEDTKRKLVEALLRLNDLSKNKAALALDLKRQNLYAWLKGTDTAISNTKKLELLALLGVRNGSLSADQIHRWRIQDLEDAKVVLTILTNQTSKPQQLYILNIWPANHADAILRLTTDPDHHVYLLLYYPLLESPPVPINAETLGIGESIPFLVILTREQWSTWLKPNEVSLSTVARIIDQTIQTPYSASQLESPAPEDQAEESEQNWLANQSPPMPTAEQITIWEDLLVRALMSGKSFDQISFETKTALGLNFPREK